jgi:hypothetical protein
MNGRSSSGAKATGKHSLVHRQQLIELGPAAPTLNAANRDADSFSLADEHDELLAARQARIEQIALKHGVMLRHNRDHHSRILRPLRLVDGGRIGQRNLIELAIRVLDRTAVEVDGNLCLLVIDARD